MLVVVLTLIASACAEPAVDKSFSIIEATGSSLPAPAAATTVVEPPIATTTTAAPPAYEVKVVQAVADVVVYPAPNAPIRTRVIPATTILGSPTVLPVVEGPVDGWILVSLPGRPNEATGWVEADQFDYAKVDQRIEVELATSTLTFFIRDEPVITTDVAIGSPDNPTPLGEFFVTDIVKLTDPTGPWGPFALGLSGRSDTITEFNGGDGIIGIHGTNRPDRIGDPVSLGCVRVPNEVIAELAGQVQLGIPVLIK